MRANRRSCREVEDLLELFVDGLVEAGDSARVREHCAQCPACRRALASTRKIRESLGAISRVRASVSVEDRVMAAVRERAARQRQTIGSRQKAVLGGAALAALFGEALAWVAVMVLLLPPLVRLSAVMPLPGKGEVARHVATLLVVGVEVALILGRAAQAVLRGLSVLLPSSPTMAAVFVSLLLTVTFFAVRRDLRSRLSARGSR